LLDLDFPGYLSVKPVPTGWHSNWNSDFALVNSEIFRIKSARYGLPKGRQYHSEFGLSRIFGPAKTKISTGYGIMFVTSISGGSLPDLTPYMVYRPKIPAEKTPLICSQNLVQDSTVPGSGVIGFSLFVKWSNRLSFINSLLFLKPLNL
jgi:hypothetical protein